MLNRLAALPVIFLVSLPAAAGNYRPDNGRTLDYPQSVLKNGSFKRDKKVGEHSAHPEYRCESRKRRLRVFDEDLPLLCRPDSRMKIRRQALNM
ncbi:hypothetical protein C9413_18315 [Rhizobium sp. SEMIA 4085]|uniref:Uncharacterized protein n=1 Tax=Rhizobium gallicum bv. gallicum R602sp TaxID=1041138 RepID=A0A0B4X3J2_9HYPH|nr:MULTISPECIES: hypothetical protein [Rhizobium]AJD41295.1 hypothetical protein RGR602_CH01965 [Rhizobium gallicum bv. gallicum R602sp]NNH31381.1 hypothetical protein [Rhizobium sp. SEMIA 4085]